MSVLSQTRGASMLWKAAIASLVGNAIEWYDFVLYNTAAALVFDKLFFPTFSPMVGHIAAFATFWVGFIARPVGGVVFGHFGDRLGRKQVLVITLIIMGLATFLIGCLPTYESLGIWATVLLVLLRFAQGFAVGGEWGGSVLLVTEHAPKEARGFYGSWPQMGVAVGVILSSLIYSWCSFAFPGDAFLDLGWRIPFFFSIVLVGIGFFIRLRIEETPTFQDIQIQHKIEKMPIFAVLRREWRIVLLAAGIYVLINGSAYLFKTFSMFYGTEVLQMPRTDIFNATWMSAIVVLAIIPLSGILSDRYGRLLPCFLGAIILTAMAFPFYWLFETRSFPLITLALTLVEIGSSLSFAPVAALFSEMFTANTRYTGISLAVQMTSVFVGGLVPIIATGLLHISGNASWPLSLYVLGMAAITLTSLVIAHKSKRLKLELR